MTIRNVLVAAALTASLALAIQAEQGPAEPPGQGGVGGGRQGGGRTGGAAAGTASRAPIGGTLTPAKADERGWGWQVKASINPATKRPFYNKAKELLFQDKQVTSYTMSSYNAELYCELRKHFEYIWFEMQHSTMS